MTTFEIIMVVLGILEISVDLGGLLVALLNFLEKRNQKK